MLIEIWINHLVFLILNKARLGKTSILVQKKIINMKIRFSKNLSYKQFLQNILKVFIEIFPLIQTGFQGKLNRLNQLLSITIYSNLKIIFFNVFENDETFKILLLYDVGETKIKS